MLLSTTFVKRGVGGGGAFDGNGPASSAPITAGAKPAMGSAEVPAALWRAFVERGAGGRNALVGNGRASLAWAKFTAGARPTAASAEAPAAPVRVSSMPQARRCRAASCWVSVRDARRFPSAWARGLGLNLLLPALLISS